MTDELILALNRLIWKVTRYGYETGDSFAEYIIAELSDAGIKSLDWDNKEQQFIRKDISSPSQTPRETLPKYDGSLRSLCDIFLAGGVAAVLTQLPRKQEESDASL